MVEQRQWFAAIRVQVHKACAFTVIVAVRGEAFAKWGKITQKGVYTVSSACRLRQGQSGQAKSGGRQIRISKSKVQNGIVAAVLRSGRCVSQG